MLVGAQSHTTFNELAHAAVDGILTPFNGKKKNYYKLISIQTELIQYWTTGNQRSWHEVLVGPHSHSTLKIYNVDHIHQFKDLFREIYQILHRSGSYCRWGLIPTDKIEDM